MCFTCGDYKWKHYYTARKYNEKRVESRRGDPRNKIIQSILKYRVYMPATKKLNFPTKLEHIKTTYSYLDSYGTSW